MFAKRALATSICLLFACFLWASSAGADMFIDRSIILFESDSVPRQDVKVSNTADENIYVQVEVLSVLNPGENNEERVNMTSSQDLSLIATPNKMVVPPGSQKSIRILNLKQGGDLERIYRINVTPIVAPLEEDASMLRIVIAYQILAIVAPEVSKSGLEVVREGKSLIFDNKGNTNVLLSRGNQCNPNNQEECQELTGRRLYAGNHWVLDLPYDGPVTYTLRSYDGIKREVFP